MIIERYTNEKEETIRLLIELQKHLVSIDEENVQTLKNHYGERYFNYLIKELENGNGILYLAKDNQQVIGMIAGYIESKDEEDIISNRCPKRGIISDLIVSNSCRLKGVGKKLMEEIENYFLASNCEFIAVDLFAPNKSAKTFYEKLGYSPRNIELYKRIRF